MMSKDQIKDLQKFYIPGTVIKLMDEVGTDVPEGTYVKIDKVTSYGELMCRKLIDDDGIGLVFAVDPNVVGWNTVYRPTKECHAVCEFNNQVLLPVVDAHGVLAAHSEDIVMGNLGFKPLNDEITRGPIKFTCKMLGEDGLSITTDATFMPTRRSPGSIRKPEGISVSLTSRFFDMTQPASYSCVVNRIDHKGQAHEICCIDGNSLGPRDTSKAHMLTDEIDGSMQGWYDFGQYFKGWDPVDLIELNNQVAAFRNDAIGILQRAKISPEVPRTEEITAVQDQLKNNFVLGVSSRAEATLVRDGDIAPAEVSRDDANREAFGWDR